MAYTKTQPTKSIDGQSDLEQKVLQISRVSRTVSGGRRMRFRALVILGDKKGKIGMGIGKGTEVALAVQKATHKARKNMLSIIITDTGTIPHEINSSYGSARIIMRPASEGTSIIAGNTIRSIAEVAGIRNLVAKIIGSSNKINNAYATIIALQQLQARPVKTNSVKKKD